MAGINESGSERLSRKQKALGSIIGGLVFTFGVTCLLLGMILAPFGIKIGGLPIPFWFGEDNINWVWFLVDWVFWIPIVYLFEYCFIGKEGTRLGRLLQSR